MDRSHPTPRAQGKPVHLQQRGEREREREREELTRFHIKEVTESCHSPANGASAHRAVQTPQRWALHQVQAITRTCKAWLR